MPYRDLRSFLEKVDQKGELRRIKAEVDWNEEMGAIYEELARRKGPAVIFENIKDHKESPGKRLTMNIYGTWERIAMALDLPINSSPKDIFHTWRNRIKNPIKPILVKEGKCKEVIKKGEEVNILDFPIPKLHPRDGGRYVMTFCANITRDPETGWVNLGLYRGMYHDRNSIGILMIPTQHWAWHGRKYQAMGRSMPLAVAIGMDPTLHMVACTPFAHGVNEYDMAGALREEPVEVIRCETNDLLVPANAEIILEGEVSLDPSTFRMEGPFGEYPGTYTRMEGGLRPVFKVNCITHRADPIFTSTFGTARIEPAGDDLTATVGFNANLWNQLEASGVEGITGVWADPRVSGCTNLSVSIKKLYHGHARQVAAAIWGTSLSNMAGKFVVVVDDDIDVFDLSQVNEAIADRTQGAKDILIFPYTQGGPLDPATPPSLKVRCGGVGNWDRVLIDATWPWNWGEEVPKEWEGLRHPPFCEASPDMRERVIKRWKELGIE